MDEQHLPATRRQQPSTIQRLRKTHMALAFGIAALIPATGAMAVSDDVSADIVISGTEIQSAIVTTVPAPYAAIEGPRAAASAAGVEADGDDMAEEIGIGVASYYGPGLEGRPTANGESFDPSQMTAAHRTLPFGSRVKVTSERTGRSVVVRINDRGPFHGKRVMDLSEAAARTIGLAQRGSGRVRMALLTP
jgi:rare lipoprotein A